MQLCFTRKSHVYVRMHTYYYVQPTLPTYFGSILAFSASKSIGVGTTSTTTTTGLMGVGTRKLATTFPLSPGHGNALQAMHGHTAFT